MVNIGSLVGDVGSRLVVNIQGHLLGLRHNNWLSGRCSRRWIPAQGADPPWYRPRDRCCPATRRHAAACHFATPARPRLQHVTRHPRGLYLSVAASAARARGLSPTCRAISASCACSVSRARMCVCVRARARVYVCGWVCVCVGVGIPAAIKRRHMALLNCPNLGRHASQPSPVLQAAGSPRRGGRPQV